MRQLRYVGQNFFTSFFFLFQSVQFDFTYLRALDTFTFLDWFFFCLFFIRNIFTSTFCFLYVNLICLSQLKRSQSGNYILLKLRSILWSQLSVPLRVNHAADETRGVPCLDINECLLNNGHGPCQDTCRNLIGGYECSCENLQDASLTADNHTCERNRHTGPCSVNNAGCSHTCLSTMGRVFCLCPDGFMLEDDWKTCQGNWTPANARLRDFALVFNSTLLPVFIYALTLIQDRKSARRCWLPWYFGMDHYIALSLSV